MVGSPINPDSASLVVDAAVAGPLLLVVVVTEVEFRLPLLAADAVPLGPYSADRSEQYSLSLLTMWS